MKDFALPLTALIIAVAGVMLSHFRTRDAADRDERLGRLEEKFSFLEKYLLKNAVLEFHSPDPHHRESDEAIEKLVEGKELEPGELRKIVDRIVGVARSADDKKDRLRAQTALVLMDEFMTGIMDGPDSPLAEFELTR